MQSKMSSCPPSDSLCKTGNPHNPHTHHNHIQPSSIVPDNSSHISHFIYQHSAIYTKYTSPLLHTTPYPSPTLPVLDPNSSGGRFQARNSLTIPSSRLEHEGSEAEDTSQSGAREGGGLAGTGNDDGGLGGGRAGVRAGGVGDGDGRVLGGERGCGLVAGGGLAFAFHDC